MKVCTTCREELPLDVFPPRKSSKDGLNTKCRPCVNDYNNNLRWDKGRKQLKKAPETTKGFKWCRKCEVVKPTSEFHKDACHSSGFTVYCADCVSHKQVLARYNITSDQYEVLLANQDYKCAICKSPAPGGNTSRFAIDHDHACCPESARSCGSCIRSLLCGRCNLVLGQVQDSTELLEAMKTYLAN